MSRRQIFIALAIGVLAASCASASKFPEIEKGIYQPTQPFENIKQVFYVRERERPLLNLITDASTSIARFLTDTHNAELGLRLPPMATTGGNGRYAGSVAYCWKSEEKDHLEFLIE
jgi:hypothetical protein